MSEGEKNQFNGNLALLRVCAIVLIVNVFNIIIKMLFVAGHGGLLASLWSALTTSSFDDFLGMGGLLIASGLAGPIVLGVLAIAFALGAGIFVLVKNNVTVLKILAMLVIALNIVGSLTLRSVGAVENSAGIMAGMVLNINFVTAVAAFFVAPQKRVEENKNVEASGSFNLGLYRFCAVCFLVIGLNGIVRVFWGPIFIYVQALISFVTVLASVFALVKRNSLVLMACSLLMVAQVLWGLFRLIYIGYFPVDTSFLLMGRAIVNSIFNTATVVYVATFFVEPERTRSYFKKVKSLFVK